MRSDTSRPHPSDRTLAPAPRTHRTAPIDRTRTPCTSKSFLLHQQTRTQKTGRRHRSRSRLHPSHIAPADCTHQTEPMHRQTVPTADLTHRTSRLYPSRRQTVPITPADRTRRHRAAVVPSAPADRRTWRQQTVASYQQPVPTIRFVPIAQAAVPSAPADRTHRYPSYRRPNASHQQTVPIAPADRTHRPSSHQHRTDRTSRPHPSNK